MKTKSPAILADTLNHLAGRILGGLVLAVLPALSTVSTLAQSCSHEIMPPRNIVTNICDASSVPLFYEASATSSCNLGVSISYSAPPGSSFGPGTHPVACVARFSDGATAFGAFSITVTTDCPPPKDCIGLQCPTNLVRYACGSNCVSVPFSVWATNHCNPSNVVVTTDYPSGYCFPLGTTWVNATASGNGQSKMCSFPVTVLSNCPPSGSIHVDVYSPTNYACGSNCVIPYYTLSATSSSDPTCTSVSFFTDASCFGIGTHTVHYRAVCGGSGETVEGEFQVVVLPDPNCPPPSGGCTNCSSGCSTNLLVNGSFESPGVPDGYVSLPGGNTVISGWTMLLNGVEYYNPLAAPTFVNTGTAADGNFILDLASMAVGGGIRQTFATVPGKSYRVSFMMGTSKERGRNGMASLTVSVAGEAHAFNVSTEGPGITWTRKEFSFVATSTSTTLVFSTMDDPALSFVNLDDVRVSDCCTDTGLRIRPTVTVEWSCGILQSAPEVTGPYTDVPGATSPYTIDASGPRRSFRTRQPGE